MSAEPSNHAPKRTPFIATAPARAALVPLEQGLGARAPFVLLTGAEGTGRSMLAREALRRRGERVAPVLFPDPAPSPAELLATLLVLYGGTPKPGAMAFALTERLMDTLANVTAAGRVAVALIDDAERLTDEHYLELQRIADIASQRQCPFELLLVGTPKLLARFDAPHMAMVRQRVSVRSTLARFSPNDTREYLQSRLNAAGVPCTGMFSRKASRDIHQVSVGVVRVIEALAAESLRRATRVGSGTVSPEHVRAAEHALRTGRPSGAQDAAPPSQVRAGAVDMAANTRSVPNAAAPRHAPSQATRPMGDAAKPVRPDVTPEVQPVRPEPRPQGEPVRLDPRSQRESVQSGSRPQREAVRQDPRSQREPVQSDPRLQNKPAQPSAVTGSSPNAAPRPAVGSRPPAAAHDPGSIGAYPGSDDPRVQEWIARFGGKGVRVGASYPTSSSPQDFADLGSNRMADADGVVSPARPIRRMSDETETALPSQLSQPSPQADPAPAPTARHASARGRDGTRASRAPLAARPGSPSRPHAFTGVLVGLVALTAVIAIGFSQRQQIDRVFVQAFAPNDTSPPATAIVHPATPPEPAPVPLLVQYSIAVGSYPTRDMASAECDYLTRLVPMRVRVNGLGGGRGYRLLLGRFDERANADLAIKRMQDQGLIPAARVIEIAPLPAAANAVTESLGTTSPDSAPATTLEPLRTPEREPSPEKPARQRARRRR